MLRSPFNGDDKKGKGNAEEAAAAPIEDQAGEENVEEEEDGVYHCRILQPGMESDEAVTCTVSSLVCGVKTVKMIKFIISFPLSLFSTMFFAGLIREEDLCHGVVTGSGVTCWRR